MTTELNREGGVMAAAERHLGSLAVLVAQDHPEPVPELQVLVLQGRSSG